MNRDIREHVYYVRGMHCASCEIFIENKLLDFGGIKSVEASAVNGTVTIEYEGKRPDCGKLNEIFEREGYAFTDRPDEKSNSSLRGIFIPFFIGLLIIAVFIGLNKAGLSELVNVRSESSLPVFFIFGLLAGVSSCAALVGGLLLSLAKHWGEIYSGGTSLVVRLQPYFAFNFGRIASYAFFGAVLGAIGKKANLSLEFGSVLVLAVSVMMIFLAFQMLGFRRFRHLQLTMPKFVTRFIAQESNLRGPYMPTLIGALTFFLPCGFTLTAQSLALISGSALRGALMMGLFALGTFPALMIIGLSSTSFLQKPHLSESFLKIAGVLVLFFTVYNINSQLNVLGLPSFSDQAVNASQSFRSTTNYSWNDRDLPPVVNGRQIIKMEASSRGYFPNYFKVRVGMPVRWEIIDMGTSGCTNAVISRNLFDGEIRLMPGQTSIREFTPTKTGKYKFSCWMGMVSGIIEVVRENETSL